MVTAEQTQAVQPNRVLSPDHEIELQLMQFPSIDVQHAQPPSFRVRFRTKPVLSGELGLSVRGSNLFQKFAIHTFHTRESDNRYLMPLGKNNPVRDHYNELTLELTCEAAPVKSFQLLFRVYDDGVAYRYVIPKQADITNVEITDEPDKFRLAGDPQMWPLYCASYTTSHEGLYEPASFSKLDPNRLIDLPLLAQFADGVSVSIAQASLCNYAGLYLNAEDEGNGRWLRCQLPPLPGDKSIKVRAPLPMVSPWRVMLIGNSPGRLIESNLILNLNKPSSIPDTTWIKPGKATFYWWNGTQEPEDVQQAVKWECDYIDFCARNQITYHTVIGTTGDHPWYFQSGPGYSPPGIDADVAVPREGFPMEKVIEYARSKNVAIRVWVHWKPLSEKLEAAFTQYEKWGLAGLMVDFLDRADQEMVLFTERVLESAARHHLNVQFHGIWAPTGRNRTYPNLFNHEGVLNLEYLKWSDQCTPTHNVTVPFTRMVAGPMDYHLGGFRAATGKNFQPQSLNPEVIGTRCQMLAMYVVFENPMPMLADRPTAYEGQSGFEFVREIPTTWDETKVLAGEVGHFIVVARRKSANWYLGAMTGSQARELKVPLRFLPPGTYELAEWADVVDSPDPNQLTFKEFKISANTPLRLNLSSGGGAVVRIKALKK